MEFDNLKKRQDELDAYAIANAGRDLQVGDVEKEFGASYVGQEFMLLVKECGETKGLSDAYPFLGDLTPVRILSDDKQFYTALVLPHRSSSTKGTSFGVSTPYRISIPKFGLRCGYFQLQAKR